MSKFNLRSRQLGQGMTEYIIIVALIAVAAIGVYQAFGSIVRGQTAAAASTLAPISPLSSDDEAATVRPAASSMICA